MANHNANQTLNVGESNKLDGVSKYNAWKIKVRTILKSAGLWEFVVNSVNPAQFPVVLLGGVQVIQAQLNAMQLKANKVLVLSVKDDVLDTVGG